MERFHPSTVGKCGLFSTFRFDSANYFLQNLIYLILLSAAASQIFPTHDSKQTSIILVLHWSPTEDLQA